MGDPDQHSPAGSRDGGHPREPRSLANPGGVGHHGRASGEGRCRREGLSRPAPCLAREVEQDSPGAIHACDGQTGWQWQGLQGPAESARAQDRNEGSGSASPCRLDWNGDRHDRPAPALGDLEVAHVRPPGRLAPVEPGAAPRSESRTVWLRGRRGKHSTVGAECQEAVGHRLGRQGVAEKHLQPPVERRPQLGGKRAEQVADVAEVVLDQAGRLKAGEAQVCGLLLSRVGALPVSPEGDETEQGQEGGDPQHEQLALDRPPQRRNRQRLTSLSSPLPQARRLTQTGRMN